MQADIPNGLIEQNMIAHVLFVHRYFVPVGKVDRWDGHVVWLKIAEDEVKKNYERDHNLDPNDFYVRRHPYTETSTRQHTS